MCGIAGVAGIRPDPAVLDRMATAILHRGPDEGGFLIDDQAGLASRRLSIIDVAGGSQPIFNEDQSAAIIFNGEVYNYRDLRSGLVERGHRFSTKSDAETVLHLWEEKGEACLQDLRGMFALAIWNRRDQSLFLARDRIGKKPLYFCRLPEGGIVFGSEIKAILQHPDVSREPDLGGIDRFLVLSYVPSPMTAFRGIARVPPAHWLSWRNGRVALQRYWNLEYEMKFREREEELSEEMLRLLREAVRIRLESEVALGAFLSGGVDSSAVVALAAEALQGPLNTFSIGFNSQRHDESAYARLVASRYETNHHELIVEAATPDLIDDIVWHYDQPFGDSSALPSFQVARLTRQHVTVVLNGDGGDESFAGYDRYQLSRLAGYFRLPIRLRTPLQRFARHAAPLMGRGQRLVRGSARDPFEAYIATLVHIHPDTRSELYSSELMSHIAHEELEPLRYMRTHPHGALLDSMLDADMNNALPDDLLVKMDVATMASSLEGRSPFLDHKLIEFIARVPANLKLRGSESKYLLKSALRNVLPNEILGRRKMGFAVPLGRWLRGGMREVLVDTVLSDRALSRGYFKPAAVRMMVQMLLAGSDRFQYQLWDLLVLERWHQMFIDEAPQPRSHSLVKSTR